MATILFAWELGQGLGHITVLRPLAERLQDQGHRVCLALRDLAAGHDLYAQRKIPLFQAPHVCGRVSNPVQPPLCTFAHILHNTALGNLKTLKGLVAGWHTLFEQLHPDAVVFDHSPSCLVASSAYSFKKVIVGAGFCCPPPISPLPNWRPSADKSLQQLTQDEAFVLANVNQVAQAWGVRYDFLAELYQQADRTMLTTFADLDHFPNRNDENAGYYGCWSSVEGASAVWPPGEGKRLFVYLRPFKNLSVTLRMLAKTKRPTIAFLAGVTASFRQQHATPSLHIVARPLALNQVMEQCDAAILQGGHGSTVSALLRGKPVFLIPTQLEQRLTAERVASLGVGQAANQHDARDIENGLRRFLEDEQPGRCAAELAQRHASLARRDQADRVVSDLLELLE